MRSFLSKLKIMFLSMTFLLAGKLMAADYWAPSLTIGAVVAFNAGSVNFSVVNPPNTTCAYWGNHFRFDANTAGGKNMYSTLLAAKTSGKPVNINWVFSGTSGMTEANGCSESTMAQVWAIAIP
jgi:hypothetical protein